MLDMSNKLSSGAAEPGIIRFKLWHQCMHHRAMEPLRANSPLSQRIVLSFLDFLHSVETEPGGDREGLEVAEECLRDAFSLRGLRLDDPIPSLPQLFAAADAGGGKGKGKGKGKSGIVDGGGGDAAAGNQAGVAGNGHGRDGDDATLDGLFEQFVEGLESTSHFEGVARGSAEYDRRLQDARETLESAINALPAGVAAGNKRVEALAEAYKIQGNTAMSSERYREAVDLYTLAISLSTKNAIYFSNRAAAHTQMGLYEEAIADCNTAIKLNPSYSKAYSRLGTVYLTQGRYLEAIQNGFQKALALDPTSSSARENIQAALSGLAEELHSTIQQQLHHSGSTSGQGARFFSGSSGEIPDSNNLVSAIMNLIFGVRQGDEVPGSGAAPESRFPPGASAAAQSADNGAGGGESGWRNVDVNWGHAGMRSENRHVPLAQFSTSLGSLMQWIGSSLSENGGSAASRTASREANGGSSPPPPA